MTQNGVDNNVKTAFRFPSLILLGLVACQISIQKVATCLINSFQTICSAFCAVDPCVKPGGIAMSGVTTVNTTQDFRFYYLSSDYYDDEPIHSFRVCDQEIVPLSDGVPFLTFPYLGRLLCNHPGYNTFLRSIVGLFLLIYLTSCSPRIIVIPDDEELQSSYDNTGTLIESRVSVSKGYILHIIETLKECGK